MSSLLIKAVSAITLALGFYTIGVWAERREKLLKPWHLAFFWLGFVMDVINEQTQNAMTLHSITGFAAIILMLLHAIWATVVIVRKSEHERHTFHRFSIFVWSVWLIPFVVGMIMGMSG